ncbi:MAG: hypothetical protein K6F92_04600 [Lachnospiraceae bacterium]|nr:hypothetical protein [Lachnospiraceae bacterium]
MVNVYEPGQECALCKGRCCKECGCTLSPADMLRSLEGTAPDRENILRMLQAPDGLYAIDSFSARHGRTYFLRMKHKCYTFIGVDAIGECIALTDSGCSLSFSERPLGGRSLKSSPDMHCTQEYTRELITQDWEPYQEALRSIYVEFEEKLTQDGTFDKCDEEYYRWLRGKREGSVL